jgi:hypothetical protein
VECKVEPGLGKDGEVGQVAFDGLGKPKVAAAIVR